MSMPAADYKTPSHRQSLLLSYVSQHSRIDIRWLYQQGSLLHHSDICLSFTITQNISRTVRFQLNTKMSSPDRASPGSGNGLFGSSALSEFKIEELIEEKSGKLSILPPFISHSPPPVPKIWTDEAVRNGIKKVHAAYQSEIALASKAHMTQIIELQKEHLDELAALKRSFNAERKELLHFGSTLRKRHFDSLSVDEKAYFLKDSKIEFEKFQRDREKPPKRKRVVESDSESDANGERQKEAEKRAKRRMALMGVGSLDEDNDKAKEKSFSPPIVSKGIPPRPGQKTVIQPNGTYKIIKPAGGTKFRG